MNKTTFDCDVEVFNVKDSLKKNIEIPKTLTVSEILNYLQFSKKIQFPKGSYILVKKAEHLYKIPDPQRDLTSFQQNSFHLIIYPPTIFLKVHCPDKRINIRSFDSQLLASQIVEILCTEIFRLQSPESYALYQAFDVSTDAFPPNSPIVEFRPEISDVWLLRRFWIKSYSNFTEENDVHYNYAQAKLTFYGRNFPYKEVDYKKLLALAIIVEFNGKTDDAAKILGKGKNTEWKKHFPEFACEKKIVKSVIELLPTLPHDMLEAKKMFIQTAIQFEYFGAATFRCSFEANGKKYTDGYLSFAERGLCFLDKTQNDEIIYKPVKIVGYNNVKKYKSLPNNVLRLTIVNEDGVGAYNYEIESIFIPRILEHFLVLLNFLKANKLKDKELNHKKETFTRNRRNTVRTAQTSFTDLMSSDASLTVKGSQLASDSSLHQIVIMDKVEAPPIQSAVTFTIPRLTREENINTEFTQYERNEKKLSSSLSPDYGISKSICTLLKKTISRECLSPLTEAENLIQSLGGSQIASDIVNGCDGGFYPTISTVAQVGALLADQVLVPLDAFSCLNYIRSIVQRFLNDQWLNFDFINASQDVNPLFARVAVALFQRSEKMIPPLAYVLLGAYDDENAHNLHTILDAVCAALMICATNIAKAFINVGMGTEKLHYILDNAPKIPAFDPVYCTNLIENLIPLAHSLRVSANARKFLAQEHKAQIDVKMIRDVVDHLSNFLTYIGSPSSLYLLSQSKRCFTRFEYPDSLRDSITIYQGAMESAYVYWYANDAKNAELAFRIEDNVQAFIDLFMSDSSYTLMAQDMLEQLNQALQRGFTGETTLEQFLDPTDPLHAVVLSLIKKEKVEEAIPLLAIDSLSLIQKRAVFDVAFKALDEALRTTALKPAIVDGPRITAAFSLLAVTCVSSSRDNPLINKAKEKITSLGEALNTLVSATPEERLYQINSIRQQVRELAFLVNDPENGCQKLIQETVAPYEISFILEKPNIDNELSSLRQITMDLSLFSAKRTIQNDEDRNNNS